MAEQTTQQPSQKATYRDAADNKGQQSQHPQPPHSGNQEYRGDDQGHNGGQHQGQQYHGHHGGQQYHGHHGGYHGDPQGHHGGRQYHGHHSGQYRRQQYYDHHGGQQYHRNHHGGQYRGHQQHHHGGQFHSDHTHGGQYRGHQQNHHDGQFHSNNPHGGQYREQQHPPTDQPRYESQYSHGRDKFKHINMAASCRIPDTDAASGGIPLLCAIMRK